jgi:hypothetical protein
MSCLMGANDIRGEFIFKSIAKLALHCDQLATARPPGGLGRLSARQHSRLEDPLWEARLLHFLELPG